MCWSTFCKNSFFKDFAFQSMVIGILKGSSHHGSTKHSKPWLYCVKVREVSETVIWVTRVVESQVLLIESSWQCCCTLNSIGYCTENMSIWRYSPCLPLKDKRDADCGKTEWEEKQAEAIKARKTGEPRQRRAQKMGISKLFDPWFLPEKF